VPRHVFPQLYLTWIRRSVSHEIADEVLVSKAGGQLSGLVTLAVKDGLGEIGLVAVAESQRGRGLGRCLMVAAESNASARGAQALEVVTQGANAAACALYTARGFELAREEAVYHIWMERP
jgi:dTDP-4-amino-4,6-dideoxy-D-galactose acyltransferase